MMSIFMGLLPFMVLAQLIHLCRLMGTCPLEAVVKGALIWTLGAVACVEVFSLLSVIGSVSLTLFWTTAAAVVALLQYRYRSFSFKPTSHPRVGDDGAMAALLLSIGLIVVIVTTIAVLSPPNNWDSMTYHLSRVEHWQQAGNIAHYPTAIVRQLAENPLAEMLILHLRVLTGNDRLANLVQTLAFVGCIAVAMLIARRLGAMWTGQVLAGVFVATLPMAILQATSTQTDLVVSFYLLVGIERLLAWRSRKRVVDALGFGLAIGFAILSKGTAYFFAAPMAGLFALGLISTNEVKRNISVALSVGVLVLVINLGHYQRNLADSGTPLGPHPGVISSHYSPRTSLSNLFWDIASNLATPSRTLNKYILSGANEVHKMLGLDIDVNHRENTADAKDREYPRLTDHWRHEDYAPNPLHLALVWLAVGMLCLSGCLPSMALPSPMGVWSYVVVVMFGGILLCLIVPWNPWIIRLELPFFLLMAPAVGTLAAAVLDRRWVIGGSTVLLVASLPYVLDNETRPVMAVLHAEQTEIPKPWNTMFRKRYGLYSAYRDAVAVISGRAGDGVGLVMGDDSWEYPLWLMLNENDSAARVRIEHICLQEGDKPIPAFTPQVLLLVDRPAPQLLSCAQGKFELEFRGGNDVYVYHRVSETN